LYLSSLDRVEFHWYIFATQKRYNTLDCDIGYYYLQKGNALVADCFSYAYLDF